MSTDPTSTARSRLDFILETAIALGLVSAGALVLVSDGIPDVLSSVLFFMAGAILGRMIPS